MLVDSHRRNACYAQSTLWEDLLTLTHQSTCRDSILKDLHFPNMLIDEWDNKFNPLHTNVAAPARWKFRVIWHGILLKNKYECKGLRSCLIRRFLFVSNIWFITILYCCLLVYLPYFPDANYLIKKKKKNFFTLFP